MINKNYQSGENERHFGMVEGRVGGGGERSGLSGDHWDVMTGDVDEE